MRKSSPLLILFLLGVFVDLHAQAPTITTQPINQSVTMGQTATFTVTATGAAPLSYQWQKNGTAIAGATSSSYAAPATSSYTTSTTTTSDNGATFSVVVSNSAGTVTSNPATLIVSQYDAKSFEVLTGVGAVVAGADSTSYNIN